MNAKAERIEQLIQIINRNLLLIYNGQVEGTTVVDPASFLGADKALKNAPLNTKIDMTVFDGDKFGYEMVNFFKSHVKNNRTSIAAVWERNFVKGVETLMIECAVVKDPIERECFVNRVYVWFNEKLVERRDLPGQDDVKYDEIELLKNTMSAMGAFHTVKALDNLSEEKAKADTEVLQQVLDPQDVPEETMAELGLEGPCMDTLKLPPIIKNELETDKDVKKKSTNSSVESRPNIDEEGFVPENETERVLHELFVARRRQEAFEWKARQNMNLVMDRRDLHRSRLDSEVLRREETSSFLAAPQNLEDITGSNESLFSETSKYVPSMRRPLSGKRHFAGIINEIEENKDIQHTKEMIETSNALEPLSLEEVKKNIPVKSVNVVKDGTPEKAKVNNIARQVVQKSEPKKQYVPMRFRTTAPAKLKSRESSIENNICREDSMSITSKMDEQQSIKRAPDKPMKIHQRESSSQKILQNLGSNDNELQIHYYFSQSRQGSLSKLHTEWLNVQEEERRQCMLENKRRLRGDNNAVTVLPPPKTKGRDDESSVSSESTVYQKYSSAQDFMSKHFPVFDSNDNIDAHGALRWAV